jgi:inner membrane protein
MGRSHLTSGALVGAIVVAVFDVHDPVTAGGIVALTAVSALLPDFDHDDATLPRWFGPLGRLLAWIIGRVFGHRGLTHSLLGLAILTATLGFLPLVLDAPRWIPAAVVLGSAVHIVGDMLTVSGCPLFWPAPRRFRLGPGFRTGKVFETAVLCPLMTIGTAVLLGSSLDGLSIPLT